VDESLSHYARLGIIHPMLWPDVVRGGGPIADTVARLAADADFDAVELAPVDDPADLARVRSVVDSARMSAVLGAQPVLLGRKLDLNAPDEARRSEAVEAVKRVIDQAAELGAERCVVLSGPDPGPIDRAKATDLLVDSLRWLCDYADHNGGVQVGLETFDRVPYGKNCLIGPSVEAADVAQRVRREFPSFGLVLDLSHLPLLDESSQAAVAAVGEHLAQAHMGNCVKSDPNHPAYGDTHPRFGLPGGENDVLELAEFLRQLLGSGFLARERRPVLSFEVKPLPGESVDALIAGSKRTLKQAWMQA
jgi:sugar phosphate isomerase/epimerase